MALALDPRYVIELQPARTRPVTSATYRRRRTVAVLLLVTLVAFALLGARAVLADRGGVPASAPAVRPAPAAAAPEAAVQVIAQPGDTLWSLAQRYAGATSVADYVEQLVELNGSPSLVAGQVVLLP